MILMGPTGQGFITIATYNQAYVDFLGGADGNSAAQAFLRMYEYGPYDLQRKDQLRAFLCKIIVLMRDTTN